MPDGTARAKSASPPAVAHWIDGAELRTESDSGVAEVHDPAVGTVIRTTPFADQQVVDAAVTAAARALPGWAAMAAPRRARILFRYRELLEQHRESLAAIVTEENGKTLAEARAEVDRGIQVVEFAAGVPHLMKGEHLPDVATELETYNIREPVGICVGITPFNFPAMVPLWMFPVAIAAGNTFVLKPSEKDPSAALRLAKLFAEAGLPHGVFNVVQGGRNTVERLVDHPAVAAVSVVGSTPVAHAVYERAAGHGKRAQCLGGAKNHMVVMPDADLDAACSALLGAAYGCAGERCMAISVAVAVAGAGEELVARLAERAPRLRVGPGAEETTDVGPLVSAEHRERVLGYLDAGIREGARLVVDGRRHAASSSGAGFFLGPCVFDHVTSGMSIYKEEIFGPVLCVVRARDLSEAIAITNAHQFANGAAIFTRAGASAQHFARDIRAGMVGVNVPVPAPTAYFGFGGHGRSLFGPLHIHGTDGVRFYTQMKTVTSRWPEEAKKDRNAPSGF